jgi:hypothetical protein
MGCDAVGNMMTDAVLLLFKITRRKKLFGYSYYSMDSEEVVVVVRLWGDKWSQQQGEEL